MWFHITSHLGGMGVQECKRKHTSTDFVKWKIFLERLPNAFNAEHHYLAQIAYVLAQVNAEKGKRFSIEQFLLKFQKDSKKVDGATDLYEEEDSLDRQVKKKMKSKMSRLVWGGMLGIDLEGLRNKQNGT